MCVSVYFYLCRSPLGLSVPRFRLSVAVSPSRRFRLKRISVMGLKLGVNATISMMTTWLLFASELSI